MHPATNPLVRGTAPSGAKRRCPRQKKLLSGRSRARFFCSLMASAALQLACALLVFSITRSAGAVVPREADLASRTAEEFRVTRIVYPMELPSAAPSAKIGGLTGLARAPKTVLSHPALPRATAPAQLPAPPELGNLPRSPFAAQVLRISLPQPPLPVDSGSAENLERRLGRLRTAKRVQVGSFSSPVSVSGSVTPGFGRHNGVAPAEFGDGFSGGGGSLFQPVRITAKPTPEYTEEGRRRKVQGQVIVEVVFHADGRAEVLQIDQSLGYGLDEAAVRAVEHIVFLPASVNGKPIDFRAKAYVLFHLLPAPLGLPTR